MAIETDIVTLPSPWALALINGDHASLTEAEEQALAAARRRLGAEGWYIVADVADTERFTWSYPLYGGTAWGGQVCDYVVHRILS